MYDSIDPFAIPVDAEAVAGYIDNPPRSPTLPAWPAGAFDRFSTPLKVRIARIATTDDGHALDVETGAATPAESRGWVQLRLAAGIIPAVYVNRGNEAAVEIACAGLQFRLWVATLDGTQTVPGALAVQYTDTGPYDLSLCDPAFFGGWFEVFTEGFRVGLAHAIISAIYNREPTQQELFDFANSLNQDLSNLADLVQGLAGQPGVVGNVSGRLVALEATVAALQANPVAAHRHNLNVTATTGTPVP